MAYGSVLLVDFIKTHSLPAEIILHDALIAGDGNERFQPGSRLVLLAEQTVNAATLLIDGDEFCEFVEDSELSLGFEKERLKEDPDCEQDDAEEVTFRSLAEVAEILSKGEMATPVDVYVRCEVAKTTDGNFGMGGCDNELSRTDMKADGSSCTARLLCIGEKSVILALGDDHKLCKLPVNSYQVRVQPSKGDFPAEEESRKAVLHLARAVGVHNVQSFGVCARLSTALKEKAEVLERRSEKAGRQDDGCLTGMANASTSADLLTSLHHYGHRLPAQRTRNEYCHNAMPTLAEIVGADEGYSSISNIPDYENRHDLIQEPSLCADRTQWKLSSPPEERSPQGVGRDNQPKSQPRQPKPCHIKLSAQASSPSAPFTSYFPKVVQSRAMKLLTRWKSVGAESDSSTSRRRSLSSPVEVVPSMLSAPLGARRASNDDTKALLRTSSLEFQLESSDVPSDVGERETFPAPALETDVSRRRSAGDVKLVFWRQRCKMLEFQLDNVEQTLRENVAACRSLRQQVEMAEKRHNRGTAQTLIKRMTCDDVQELLKEFDLGQYCQRFSEQQVDGKKLVALNERLLESSLSIKNRFHCLKIMQLTRGNIHL